MRYPLTRAAALATTVYNVYALVNPGALTKAASGQVTAAESQLLGRTWAARDLPVSALMFSGDDAVVRAAVGLRVAADIGDAAVLGTRLHGVPQRKIPGIAAGWALVSLAAHLGDHALARRRGR